jgi:hypothetical protein
VSFLFQIQPNRLIQTLFFAKQVGQKKPELDLQQDNYLYNSEQLENLTKYADVGQLEEIQDYLGSFEKKHQIFEADSYAHLYIDIGEKINKLKKRQRQFKIMEAKRNKKIDLMRQNYD